MNWWIVFACLVVLGFAGLFIGDFTKKSWQENLCFTAMFGGWIIAFVLLIVCIAMPLSNAPKIQTFKFTKAFIDDYQSNDKIEDFALTTKIIDLNNWLFEAQGKKSAYGGWSFYPDEVMTFEPIKSK